MHTVLQISRYKKEAGTTSPQQFFFSSHQISTSHHLTSGIFLSQQINTSNQLKRAGQLSLKCSGKKTFRSPKLLYVHILSSFQFLT
jgi:hypothetical protein